jgi:hypothetical protein
MCHPCHRIRFCVVWNALKRLKASESIKKSRLNRLDSFNSFNSFSWENALRINENI